VACPLLALWGAKGKVGVWYEPLEVWRRYASGEVTGSPVSSGHYLAEEAPQEVLAALEKFLSRRGG
jgi:haloacetate dehalogenase